MRGQQETEHVCNTNLDLPITCHYFKNVGFCNILPHRCESNHQAIGVHIYYSQTTRSWWTLKCLCTKQITCKSSMSVSKFSSSAAKHHTLLGGFILNGWKFIIWFVELQHFSYILVHLSAYFSGTANHFQCHNDAEIHVHQSIHLNEFCGWNGLQCLI